MFERFTQEARQVIFYGRYEASHLGSHSIQPEHLLLGILRNHPVAAPDVVDSIRNEILASFQQAPPTPTAMDMPLTEPSKRVLKRACEEAGESVAVETRHLLLAILSESDSICARLLQTHGVDREQVLLRIPADASLGSATGQPPPPEIQPHTSKVNARLEDGSLVCEAHKSFAGAEIITIERFRLSEDEKTLAVSYEIRGPKGVHRFDTEVDLS